MRWSYRLIGIASLVANAATLAYLSFPAPRPAIAAAASPAVPSRGAGSASAQRRDDGLFHLDGHGRGGSARFVVDTGASVTVLTAADAAALGTEPILGEPAAILETAGGRTAMTWHRLRDFAIAGQRIGDIEVAVVKDGIGRSLLGQDVLAQLGTITIAEDRLRIVAKR